MTGMTVKTVVNDNLLIAGDTFGSTARLGDDNFANTLTQTLKAILEPASAVDAKTFYYTSTTNVKASGDAIAETYIPYDNYTGAYTEYGLKDNDDSSDYKNAFSQNYGVTKTNTVYDPVVNNAEGYKDYVFQLKALNTSSSPQYINLTQLNLIYAGTHDASEAYRIGVFVQDITDTAPAGNVDSTDVNAIYTQSGADNFTSGNAVDGLDSLASVTYQSSAKSVATVPANTTKYFKVVVRLWLEGEDTTCNNDTFMALTDAWELDLELKLETTQNQGVAYINKTATAAVSTTNYYFDGQYFYSDRAKIGTTVAADRTAYADASTEVKNAFNLVGLTQTLTNVTSSTTSAYAYSDEDFRATYTPASTYNLPATITVTNGGSALASGTDYIWNKGTGELVVYANSITGALVVTISGTST